jgi:hypothetical protein
VLHFPPEIVEKMKTMAKAALEATKKIKDKKSTAKESLVTQREGNSAVQAKTLSAKELLR